MSEVIFSHVTTVAKLTGLLNYIYTQIQNVCPKSNYSKIREEKKRKQNFNSEECNLLVNIVEQNLDTLRGQFSSTITNAKKQKLWETIYFPD